jgi:multidrug resistance efflux pump
MIPEIELYEALVGAGVSKDKARDVVLAQKETMDQFLTTLATKADLAATLAATKADLAATKTDLTATLAATKADLTATLAATKADLSAALAATNADLAATKADLAEFRAYVDGRFNLVAEQMISMTNKIVVRLGALMVVLIGLLGTVLALTHR